MSIILHSDVPVSAHKYAAIVSLDPAGSGPCGIACRATASLPTKPSLSRLRAPDYIYEGKVWNDVMLDELCAWLARNVGGQKALLVAENSTYGSLTIATSIGRCIGAIQCVMYYAGWAKPEDTIKLAPRSWRGAAGIPAETKGRQQQKDAAIKLVTERYGLALGSDASEAILINDAAVIRGEYK